MKGIILKKYLIFVVIILACSLHIMAKQPSQMKRLSIQDGLSNNFVKHIVQDGQGFIWIAAEAGLSRFDGSKFTTYSVVNSELIDDAINVLLYDSFDNLLWIGTKTVLSVLNCSTYQFEHYLPTDGVDIGNVVDIALSGDSAVWIVNHTHGIVHFNKRTGQFTAYSDKNIKGLKNTNWCCFDDGKGYLYVGHAQNGLSIVNLAEKTTKHFLNESGNNRSLPGNSVYSIYADHMDNLWIGTNQGLALYNQRNEEFLTFRHESDNPYSLIADHIYDIKEMSDGTLWIATDIGGISVLDLYNFGFVAPEKVKFNHITATSDDNDLSSGNIRSLLQDSYGNIWIGNYSSGIDVISHTPPLFHTLPYTVNKKSSYKNKSVWGIYADAWQQVWAGSENEITVFKDNKLVRTIQIKPWQTRPYTQVFSIEGNQQGILLLGLFDDGLLELDTQTSRVRRIDLGMDNVDVITFYRDDDDGSIWIGAEYGVYKYMNGMVQKENEITRQLTDKSVYGILRDKQGKLWIGGYGGGIQIFDLQDKPVYHLCTHSGFFSNAINYIYKDTKGGVWIATRHGLGYIKDTAHPDQFEHYASGQGLTDLFVRSIQEDMSGNIWVSTNSGISRWDKETHKFSNYNYTDGVPAGNFIEGSSCILSDGTIYFGSMNGICYFDPDQMLAEQKVAPVQIIEYKEDGIHVKHNQNSFRITFAVPDFAQSQKVEYAYMVEGLDDSWIHTQGENQVTLRSLPAGRFTFKVKSRLKNQDWDEQHIASMNIYIHPPLWLTWYAKLLYAVIICLIIAVSIKSYKRRLKLKSSLEIERRNNLNEQNLNQERLRFYTNITHEFRTPLTLILGPLEDLTNDKNMPIQYNKILHTIHGSALRLLNLINQILEFRKTETQNRELTVTKGNIVNLVMETGLRYKELNQNTRLNFHIQTPTEPVEIYFDADIITTILNNLLSNAVKYTPDGEISLILESITESGNEYTQIKVSDTGYGIEPEILPHIFDRYYQAKSKHQASGTGIGLALVKSLASIHESTLDVESCVGEGSVFTLRLLTGNTYPNALHKETEQNSSIGMEEGMEEEEKPTTIRPLLLIVEDNNDIREYIKTSFNSDYKIIEAGDGTQGLELATTRIPNIIVSDIMMPGMDGIEFCRRIKEDVRTSHIPVILLTAKDSIRDKEEGYESGADSYLTKPFSARLLRSRMQNLLELRRKLAQQITAGHQKDSSVQEPLRMSKLDEEFLKNLTGLIEENLSAEHLDLAFLIQHLNMSSTTFYCKVKGLTGIPPNEFIRKIRLRNSRRLLLSGDYNISEAAYMTGFNNLSHFRKSFKKEYEMTPSEYIRKISQEKNNKNI